jgi:pyruvate ferredoxin oxidoreductase gamma subunit/2-oxoisovalerate ferredoxin oxidoreductase gamma subunit
VATINATEIAVRNKLGTLAAPIVNTAIIGAVVKIMGLTKLESLVAAIREGIPIKSEENIRAAKEAFEKA